jgi:hypothetical protein
MSRGRVAEPAMTTMPISATALASRTRRRTLSPIQRKASPAATNGTVA